MSFRKHIIKRIVAWQMSGWSEGEIDAQRSRESAMSKFIKLPLEVDCQAVQAGDVSAEWIRPPAANSAVILYFHGGAYALGSIEGHRELIARLAHATHCRCLAIEYRLAPENPYPAALEDALAAYRWLQTAEAEPMPIILAGDSAGGGLALATIAALGAAGEPLPRGAICLSPWTDLCLTGPSIEDRARKDPILDPASLRQYAAHYAAGHPPGIPTISPLYAGLEGFPPLLIQVGTDEILFDDAARFAQKAQAAGVQVSLQIFDGMFHGFQMLPSLRESRQALDQIARFVSSLLGDQSPGSDDSKQNSAIGDPESASGSAHPGAIKKTHD